MQTLINLRNWEIHYLQEQMGWGSARGHYTVCHPLILQPRWILICLVPISCRSHHFLEALEVLGTLEYPLLQGFPSLLVVQLGQSLAVHLWSGNLHHQGDPVDLSLQESPSGLDPQVHPDRHMQWELKQKRQIQRQILCLKKNMWSYFYSKAVLKHCPELACCATLNLDLPESKITINLYSRLNLNSTTVYESPIRLGYKPCRDRFSLLSVANF